MLETTFNNTIGVYQTIFCLESATASLLQGQESPSKSFLGLVQEWEIYKPNKRTYPALPSSRLLCISQTLEKWT